MGRIIKTALNGGRVAPQYWWRPDLAFFPSACKTLLNWLAEVSGAVTMRPGFRILFNIGQGSPSRGVQRLKQFKFQYGADDYDRVVITTGSHAPGELAVYDLNNAKIFSASVDYTFNDIDSLEVLQSFDVLLIFSSAHPTLSLKRMGRLDWSLSQHPYKGGPWAPSNLDRSVIVSTNIQKWADDDDYLKGDIVVLGDSSTTTGSSELAYYGVAGNPDPIPLYLYHTVVFTATTPIVDLEAGDKVTIEGAVASGGGDQSLDGDWTIASLDKITGRVLLETGTVENVFTSDFLNLYAPNDMSSASIIGVGQRQSFHTALQDNTNEEPDPETTTEFWTADAYLSGDVQLKSTQDLWSISDENRSFRVRSNLAPKISGDYDDTTQGDFSLSMPVYGLVELTTEGGTWDGELVLQLSLDSGGSWDDLGLIESIDGSRNGTITRTITDFGALVRAYMRRRGTATGDTGCKFYITTPDMQHDYYEISEYVDARTVNVRVASPVASLSNSWRWNEWAFGGERGYPATAVIQDDIMIVSGVPGNIGTVYFSTLGDFTNFVPNASIGGAFDLQIGQDTRNVIRWIKAKEALLIGTDAGEWTISPRDVESVLSIENFNIQRQGEYGSAAIPAIVVGDFVIYVENGGYRLRGLEGSIYDKGVFRSTDLTFKVPDWFTADDPVKQMDYSRSPIPTLWVLLKSGRLYAWVFDANNAVSAWSEITQTVVEGGSIESILVVPGASGDVLSAIILSSFGGDFDYSVLTDLEISNDALDGMVSTSYARNDILYQYPTRPQDLASDPFKAHDGAYLEVSDVKFTSTSGDLLFSLINPVAVLVVKNNGLPLGIGVDYFQLEDSGVYWIPDTQGGAITLYDFITPLTLDVDYVESNTAFSQYVTLFPDSAEGSWANIDISGKKLGIGSSVPVPAHNLREQTDGSMIVIGYMNLVLTYNVGVDALVRGLDYLYQSFYNAYMLTGLSDDAFRRSKVIVGRPIDNLIEPVDMVADLRLGGPGGVVRLADNIDLMVVNSLGLQIRASDRDQWTVVPDVSVSNNVGETLPLYTGVQRVDLTSGCDYNGTALQIRSTGPRKSTVASIAIDVERNK